MVPWMWFCWISVCFIVLSGKGYEASSTYNVYHQGQNFDQAAALCTPGVLTTLVTEKEVNDILDLITETVPPRSPFTFWIGLRKPKQGCVVPTLPLRGFQWTEDGSEDSQVIRWAEEPQSTCTTVRCAVLQGQQDQSNITNWGLMSVSCRNFYPFICKQTATPDRPTPETAAPGSQTPELPEPDLALPVEEKTDLPEPDLAPPVEEKTDLPEPEPEKPQPPEPVPTLPEPPVPEPPTPDQSEPETPKPYTPAPELPVAVESEAESGHSSRPSSGPVMWSNVCENPLIQGARSLIPDPDNSSRILVECWSTIRLELRCRGQPALWRLLNDDPADFSTVCQPCATGFRKDLFGQCVDVDECSGSPCRTICLNTQGSYRCVCADPDGQHHDEDSPECKNTVTVEEGGALSGILIPVAVGVAALVVLVVLVVVLVKCCLMRRSKTREEQTEENMTMKKNEPQDSFESANEKPAS